MEESKLSDIDYYEAVVAFANQASLALSHRQYQEALKAYTSALEVAKELQRSRLIAVLLNRMGQVLQAQGKIQDSAKAYESALRALEKDTTFNLDSVVNRLSQGV
jgi:tetratricopeptide (TPR) repeat protein